MRGTFRLLCVGALLFASGCASVHVMKVVDGTSQPEGIPFYLPRPYVQVYEPFVVSSQVFLAAGQVSADGKFLLIDNINSVEALKSILAVDVTKERGAARVPLANVRVTPVPNFSGGTQSGNGSDSAGGGKPADKPSDPASAPTSAASTPTNTASSGLSGQFTSTVAQSSVPFPSTLGRRFFDVVWMPDFDEKYVVQSTPGLGGGTVGVTMVQGWGLYGLDAKIDNSAIVKPLLDFYSTGLGALSQLAKSKILPASAIAGGVQSGPGDVGVTALQAGARVSVKVTKVSVAAPGLYPILKPNEKAVAVDAVSGNAVKGNLLIPQRPYTNIAFNIYDVLVIEAAKPSGDTPMNLQQYFEPSVQSGSNGGGQVVAPTDMAALTTNLNAKLKTVTSDDKAYWVLSKLAMNGDKLTGTATLTGGRTKPGQLKDMKALTDFVALEAKVSSVNITLTENSGG